MLTDVIGFIPFALDIGHGIDNPKAYAGFSEFDYNQRLAEAIIPVAIRNGFMPVLAQGFNKTTVGLTSRYNVYDSCKVGFSLHVDAHSNLAVNGLSLYHWITSKSGKKLAETYAEVFGEYETPIRLMKVDEADADPSDGTYDNMGILRETAPPFILVEHGYKTNNSDRDYLSTQESVNVFAEVLVKTLCKYFNKEYVEIQRYSTSLAELQKEMDAVREAVKILTAV